MSDLQAAGGWATIGLGLGQALVPQTAARAFGLAPLDAQGLWLARLLGTANVALGTLALDAEHRHRTQTTARGVLAANAAATLLAARSGGIPKRTAGLVLAFVGGLLAAELTAEAVAD